MKKLYLEVSHYNWWDFKNEDHVDVCPRCKEEMRFSHDEFTTCPSCRKNMIAYGAVVLCLEPNHIIDKNLLYRLLNLINEENIESSTRPGQGK